MTTPTIETTGQVRSYETLDGSTGWAVEGPKGTYLVTPDRRSRGWNVWRSDSLTDRAKAITLHAGIAAAAWYAGAVTFDPSDPVTDRPDRTPDCARCVELYLAGERHHPPHTPSPRCESGGEAHCACPICFG